MNRTNFPQDGEDKEIALRHSNYEQFDYEFALDVQKNHKNIWNAGGKRKAENAFKLWDRARHDEKSTDVEKFVKSREKYIKEHKGKEDVSAVVGLMKWGGICEKGINYMKDLIRAEINKSKQVENKSLTRRELLEKNIKDGHETIVYKNYHVELKKFEEGEYRFCATKEIRDADDEIVAIDGISFDRYAKNPVWLWGHRMMNGDIYDVIGKCINWKIELDDTGIKMLTFEPVYAPHQKSQDLKRMHELGIAAAISIGFRVKEYDFETQTITSCELYEVSNVIVPSNPEAIQMAKSKGFVTAEEEKSMIKDLKYDEYKILVKEFRKKFLSNKLCKLLSYEKLGEGKELDDITNIYAILVQAITSGDKVENQQVKTASQENLEPVLTKEDAKNLVKGIFF